MSVISYSDAIVDFLKAEGLQDVPRLQNPNVAAAGTTAKAILASPLLSDTLKQYGVQASSFRDYKDCAELTQDSSWDMALVLAPCKPDAYTLTSEHLAPIAMRTKVVDTILRQNGVLYGINTNMYAVQLAIRQLVGNQAPKAILVAGTSATARSVIVALHQLYPEAEIDVIGRNLEKIETAIEVCGAGKAVQEIKLGTYDLVVNATSVGVSSFDDRLDYPLEDTFEPGVRFFDVIIGHTYLQQTALAKGCSVISGAAMQRATNALRAGLVGGK